MVFKHSATFSWSRTVHRSLPLPPSVLSEVFVLLCTAEVPESPEDIVNAQQVSLIPSSGACLHAPTRHAATLCVTSASPLPRSRKCFALGFCKALVHPCARMRPMRPPLRFSLHAAVAPRLESE